MFSAVCTLGDGESEMEEEEENGAEEREPELFEDNYVAVGKIFRNIINII